MNTSRGLVNRCVYFFISIFLFFLEISGRNTDSTAMCGIFGYINYRRQRSTEEVLNILINGLQRLEYRGYDSAGVCIDNISGTSDGKPIVIREVGNVNALRAKAFDTERSKIDMQATGHQVGIAHTRWATHGEPCERNAHPHSSNKSEFVVVHNGIMTNYAEVKKFLEGLGYFFVSDTDTEVIAVLAQYLKSQRPELSFAQLVMEVMELIGGAYALVFKSSLYYPGELVACKRGSPMIVGIKRVTEEVPVAGESHTDEVSEVFISSDSTALVEHTKQVVYLEDDDVVHCKEGSVFFFNKSRNEDYKKLRAESRELHNLEVAVESLTKGTYEHFMQKEIFEQSESVMNTMRGRLNFQTKKVLLGGFSDQNVETILSSRRLLFISCGTSLNSCLAIRPLFDELLRIPISVENASDFLDRRPTVFRDDVCIFVSQSGETADTLRALEYCKAKGATLVGFTNTVGSSISRLTDFGAHLNCGVEVGVASTKAYTSQIVALMLMCLLLSDDAKRLSNRRNEIIEALQQLSSDISTCLRMVAPKVKELAKKLVNAKSVLVLGRGYQYASCLEAALKIKELTYVHTEGINSGELKHGPLALIDENIPVIIFCTRDLLIDRARSAIQQVKARKGKPIAIVSEADEEVEGAAEDVVTVPKTVDCLQSVVNIIPLQLLAYELAVLRGNNVDCPRNLAKSVTTQ